MVDCSYYTERRSRCHSVYGSNKGEECVHESLTEKRCLSIQRCPRQALEYYGYFNDSNIDGGKDGDFLGRNDLQEYGTETRYRKALCASWAESFAYGDKELEFGQDIARHHREAHRIVSSDSKLRKECRQLAMQVAECLRATRK